jgi:hypothetical protein
MTARKENGIYVVRETMEVNRYDFDGTADQLKANIDLIVEKARVMGMVGEGWFDLDLMRYGHYDDYYDDYCELKITYNFDRVENEKEKSKREDAEAKMKKNAEYAEYLRLKEKFKEV